jgi:MFS family permease
MLAGTLAMIAALLLLLFSSTYESILLASCLAGMALGCVLPSSAALVAACFGSPSFGRVMGMIYVAVVVSSILCARFIGDVFDRTGGYHQAFQIFLAIAVLAALTALLVRAPQDA